VAAGEHQLHVLAPSRAPGAAEPARHGRDLAYRARAGAAMQLADGNAFIARHDTDVRAFIWLICHSILYPRSVFWYLGPVLLNLLIKV
jgi:hypothetical protein